MHAPMMQPPLLIASLLRHAERHHAMQEVVCRRVEGGIQRCTSAERAVSAGVPTVWPGLLAHVDNQRPIGTVGALKGPQQDLSVEQRRAMQARQGRSVFGIDMKTVGDDGRELPWDGPASGERLVRGHWVVDRYRQGEESPLVNGWFPTGDVATIDADGFLDITDRAQRDRLRDPLWVQG